MDIQGTYTLPAAPALVWQQLLDKQVLRKAIPGVEQIEQVDKHTYTLTIDMKHSVLNGVYQGQLVFNEQHYPSYYSVSIELSGPAATIHGTGNVNLTDQYPASTVIAYNGVVTVNQNRASLSPSLLRGAIKLLIQQFFTAFAGTLPLSSSADEQAPVTGQKRIGGIIQLRAWQDRQSPQPPSTTVLFQQIAHLLHLGAGETEQEEIWGKRLKRASIISGFLLLVWLGTRLPRKPVKA